MNKSVCLQCYIKNVLNLPRIDTVWTLEDFAKNWDYGTVSCPHHIVFPAATRPGTWSVDRSQAFEHCPRKLEHAVADSVNIDTDRRD